MKTKGTLIYLQLITIAWSAPVFVSVSGFAAEPEFFLSPAGDDRSAGTQEAPWRNPQRAQEEVRLLAGEMRGDIAIHFAPGEYRLGQTWEFTEADSGQNGFRVIYRSLFIGHNIENRVENCLIEHMGVNGVTFSNRFLADDGKSPTSDQCRGNLFHHLSIHHCGQDSGDMGAVHAANLNIPGGDAVNAFEQIVVADMQPYPTMIDYPPDGVFLDWPSKSMHQVFRNFQVVRVAGMQLRSHKPENGGSAVTENVSWKPGFREDRMDYENIGVTEAFPAAYGGRPGPPRVP